MDAEPQPTRIVLAGEGDPALHTAIGDILRTLRRNNQIPVAVQTSGVLLSRDSVRTALHQASQVIVKLDAVSQRVLNRINRPHKSVRIEKHLHGVTRFRHEYTGSFLLETVIVAGINDQRPALRRLFQFLRKLEPEAVFLHVYTVGNRESFVKQVQGAAGPGTDFGELPVVLVDGRQSDRVYRRSRPAGQITSDSATTWEAIVHAGRSEVLARSGESVETSGV